MVHHVNRQIAIRPWVLGVALVALLAGCDSGRASITGQSTPSVPAASDFSSCPATVLPPDAFVPPSPYLPKPPEYYRRVWYGTADLWTMLDADGRGFTDKTFWWSSKFQWRDELQPNITVTVRRLDARGATFTFGNPGTHALADFGTAMLVGIDIPTWGCWEIRGEYEGVVLSYVVKIPS